MNLSELNELDMSNIASWPLAARIAVIVIVFVAVLGLGYWFDIKEQGVRLEKAEQQETALRQTFEVKAKKAANLAAYEQQLVEMKESFGAMLRQLPNKTEVAELLVDISQTGLGSLDFASRLLEEKLVAVIPGKAFGNDSYVRISFATSLAQIEKGMNRIEAWVKQLQKKS